MFVAFSQASAVLTRKGLGMESYGCHCCVRFGFVGRVFVEVCVLAAGSLRSSVFQGRRL